MPKDEELNQQLKNHKIPLQGGGKEFVSECNEHTNSGGGQLSASHPNDYVTLNLFQGLANVAEGDDLKTQTAVNCDECQILKRVQNDEIGVVVPPPEPLNSRKFVKWFRPPLRRGHQANYDETNSNTQEYRNNRKEQLQMKTKNKINESTAQTHSRNYLVPQCLSNLVPCKRVAFTLAETLITLAIIGVVAAITIPSLVKNYNEKAWSTAQKVFTERLEVATRQMNTEEKLAGYSSTMDFVNELKKYIKITRVCDNNNITKCFNKEVIWNEGEDPIDMSEVTDASAFGLDWKFSEGKGGGVPETVAVQFANGVNAIIAYNPNTTQDPFNNQFSATSNSMAILYDVSGNKNPNTNGKDIGKINVEELAGTTGCAINPDLVGGMCISQILAPGTGYSPMTLEECNQAVSDGELGIKACNYNSDYWAGAVKACGGINNMPTMEQLGQLATYVYNYDGTIGAQQDVLGLTLDTTKAAQFLSASPGSNYFYVWSGQEYSSGYAYTRYFDSTYTDWNDYYRDNGNRLAVCLDH